MRVRIGKMIFEGESCVLPTGDCQPTVVCKSINAAKRLNRTSPYAIRRTRAFGQWKELHPAIPKRNEVLAELLRKEDAGHECDK